MQRPQKTLNNGCLYEGVLETKSNTEACSITGLETNLSKIKLHRNVEGLFDKSTFHIAVDKLIVILLRSIKLRVENFNLFLRLSSQA